MDFDVDRGPSPSRKITSLREDLARARDERGASRAVGQARARSIMATAEEARRALADVTGPRHGRTSSADLLRGASMAVSRHT